MSAVSPISPNAFAARRPGFGGVAPRPVANAQKSTSSSLAFATTAIAGALAVGAAGLYSGAKVQNQRKDSQRLDYFA